MAVNIDSCIIKNNESGYTTEDGEILKGVYKGGGIYSSVPTISSS